MIVFNEEEARYYFKMYSGHIRFLACFYSVTCSEESMLFSNSIARYQDLVRFDE